MTHSTGALIMAGLLALAGPNSSKDVSNLNTKPKQVTSHTSLSTSSGKASYYWQGKLTANGERYNPAGVSCAHKTLPFNTRVVVTNLENGKSVVCRINDRGPYIKGRVIDLSVGAAKAIDMTKQGVVRVQIGIL
jgi:rare lipoprotein A